MLGCKLRTQADDKWRHTAKRFAYCFLFALLLTAIYHLVVCIKLFIVDFAFPYDLKLPVFIFEWKAENATNQTKWIYASYTVGSIFYQVVTMFLLLKATKPDADPKTALKITWVCVILYSINCLIYITRFGYNAGYLSLAMEIIIDILFLFVMSKCIRELKTAQEDSFAPCSRVPTSDDNLI